MLRCILKNSKEYRISMNESLFWDANAVDLDKDSVYIIERILCYGNQDDFSWLLENYSLEKIKEVYISGRNFDPKTISCFNNIFGCEKKRHFGEKIVHLESYRDKTNRLYCPNPLINLKIASGNSRENVTMIIEYI